MLTKGFFEINGSAEDLLPLLASKTLKSNGVVYFADFGDGTIKVGMTRGPKARVNGFWKTAESYSRSKPIKFGISPILTNHEVVEKLLHKELSAHWVERELFRTTEEVVEQAASNVSMYVLRSCMWPACKGYGKAKALVPGLAVQHMGCNVVGHGAQPLMPADHPWRPLNLNP